MSESMPAAGRPHVVMILCDQLRADALGFMGNERVRTPNLDRLAARGVVFDNLYVQSPVCMSSRACMLTGRYMRTLRMGNGTPLLDPRETTLPELLQRGGYRTGMFGKLHLTPQQYTFNELGRDCPVNDAGAFVEAAGIGPMPTDPFKRNYGFNACVAFEDILWGEYAEWVRGKDAAVWTRLRTREGRPGDVWTSDFPGTSLRDVGPLDIPAELHPSSFIADAACRFFREHHEQQPCFVHLSFVDPHHPWNPPREIAEQYDPATMTLPAYRDSGGLNWPPTVRERLPDHSDVTDDMTRTAIAYYLAMIDMIDRAVGRLLDQIAACGQSDNTVFLFVADHGEFLGDYGLWRKGAMHYDCLIRVPCFVAWPGCATPGRRVAGLVQSIDLAPTLLGLLGMKPHDGMQGLDLSPRLIQPAHIGRHWAYTESYRALWGPFLNCWTVRTPTAKLNYYPSDRVGHLIDLENDPDERVDLYASSDHRALRDEMMDNLIEAVHSQADPLPKVLSQY